jgi:hypothetical protein
VSVDGVTDSVEHCEVVWYGNDVAVHTFDVSIAVINGVLITQDHNQRRTPPKEEE